MACIHVQVVKYQDCRNLILRYKDPVTGKWSRTTKYRDPRTGQETETGGNRKQAKKLAALLEADLNSGRDQGRNATGWQTFRLRYEEEVLPSLAPRTGVKIGTVFNAVEKALPRVAAGKLADLNAQSLSRFQAELRNGERSEAMRHESIETTMRYYVGRNANTTADAVWSAYQKSQEGTVLGTVAQNEQAAEVAGADLSGCVIGS
jgi:hypothetical protein